MIQKLKNKMASNQKGFTLIELMIVIAIIGILAAIAVPQFLSYRMRSYNTAAKAVANNVKADQGNLNAEFGVFGHTTGDSALLSAGDTAPAGAPYSATTAVDASAAVPNVPGARLATSRLDGSGIQGAVGIALGLNMNITALNTNDANNNSTFVIYARHVKGDSAYGVDSDIENQLFFINNPDTYVNQVTLIAPSPPPGLPTVPANEVAGAGYGVVP